MRRVRTKDETMTAEEFLLAEVRKTYPCVGGLDDYHARSDLWEAYIAAGFDSHREFHAAIKKLTVDGKIRDVCAPIGRGGAWLQPVPGMAIRFPGKHSIYDAPDKRAKHCGPQSWNRTERECRRCRATYVPGGWDFYRLCDPCFALFLPHKRSELGGGVEEWLASEESKP